ncbi:MAG: pyridoxal kinase PdxY [Nocardioides sp.]
MKFLSIQSSVAYGHVGNSAAVFPLQRLGHEVWPVSTVVFSNHTGYDTCRGPLLPPGDVADLITGIEERGVLDQVDGVLSGYQGSADIAGVILDAVSRVRAANPRASYTCDPVMGNAGSGCFVHPDIPPVLRERVVPRADVITPNQFELGFLTGTQPQTLDELLTSAELGQKMGPRTVLVTSVQRADRPADAMEMLVVTDDGAWIVQTPRLPLKANGSGDVTSALFTAHLLATDAPTALGRTAASVFALLDATLRSGERELRLVQAQEAFVAPPTSFEVHRIR